MKSWNEIRRDATAFSRRWKDAYDEKSQAEIARFFDYKDIVYNNFVWPDEKQTDLLTPNGVRASKKVSRVSGEQIRLLITKAAQAVLDARAAHPNATLADLYDPLTMPQGLVKAHARLDALVDKAYGFGRDKAPSQPTDADRVSLLFKLYAERTQP